MSIIKVQNNLEGHKRHEIVFDNNTRQYLHGELQRTKAINLIQ